MTIFQITSLLLTAAALGGYVNYKFIGLPASIGHMAFALLVSLMIIGAGFVGWLNIEQIKTAVNGIDFSTVVLHGLISFLLFAGALHVDLNELKGVKWPVGILATLGVILATFITGSLVWAAASWMGINLPFIYALLFGALISPTDPIAVLSILKQAGISKTLYVKIGGESLFNDGVGVVVFLAVLGVLFKPDEVNISSFCGHFLYEGGGGLTLGMVFGWITYFLMRSIDDYKTEVMLSLALVMGGFAVAEAIHVSAPLCMVAAGLIIGNQGRNSAMSETTRKHMDVFWELIDEVLNAVLFLLIGLEILIVSLSMQIVWLGALTFLAVLVGRFISVGVPVSLMRLIREFDRGTIRLLTWGGLRGGLSIAMALSLPNGDEKSIILALTYIVVLLSIFVQGLSFNKIISLVFKSSV